VAPFILGSPNTYSLLQDGEMRKQERERERGPSKRRRIVGVRECCSKTCHTATQQRIFEFTIPLTASTVAGKVMMDTTSIIQNTLEGFMMMVKELTGKRK
jgi:hypothetical protein